MAALKKQRGPIRAAFTRTLNELKTELEKDEKDKKTIQQLFRRLEGHRVKLVDLDSKIGRKMLTDDDPEEEFANEYESTSEYQSKFEDVQVEVERAVKDEGDDDYSMTTSGSRTIKKSKYKLPKLEFKKFSGEPRDWLTFWSQFRSIHEDEEMAANEKYQYLIQATTEGSKAREIIESFPATEGNYPKVIKYLKERFGRDDILVEVYVRDMLRLVLENSRRTDTACITDIYDKLETQLRALETLGVTQDKYASMLYPLVESSLPEEILRVWERVRNQEPENQNQNRLELLMKFLRSEVRGEERVKLAKAGFSSTSQAQEPPQKKQKQRKENSGVSTATDLLTTSSSKACIFCSKSHESSACYQAAKMSLEDLNKAIKEKNGCYICLKTGHFSNKCKSKHKCQVCLKRHFVVMCPDLPKNKKPEPESPPTEELKNLALSNQACKSVLLQTLLVKISHNGHERVIRTLVDSGSQQSYVTEKAATVLGLSPVEEVKMAHCLFGGQKTNQKVHRKYEVTVASLNGKFQCQMEVLDSPKICGEMSRVPSGPWIQELKNFGIEVSDVGNDTPEIHLLIGADVAGKLLTGRLHPSVHGPVAVETKLGWTLMGECKSVKRTSDSSLLVHSLHLNDVNIQELWKLDVIGIRDPVESLTRNEILESANKHFLENIRKTEDGRYEVALPWLECHPPIADNKDLALKRLHSTTKKVGDLGIRDAYTKIFRDWEDNGIIERVPDVESGHLGSYLPHHPVLKPLSQTTPIRPVFDASTKSKGKSSLNECLEKGPNLIELILDILTRFRLNEYGVVSDIKKAFLQISLKKEDRDFLRFLWWEDQNGESKMITYRHRRVLFGVSSSPFLLAATINYHLDRTSEEMKPTAMLLKKSLYVDNCIVSLSSERELEKFIREVNIIMEKAKFELRGWVWSKEGDDTKGEDVPVLGLLWNTARDTLRLDMRGRKISGENVTKRSILAAAHRIFDPIGFSSPTTLIPKMMLQELWIQKLGWDTPVTPEVEKKFKTWENQIGFLEEIEIPRWIFSTHERMSLHVFADASKVAYAGCVFLRVETGVEVQVQLVLCKTRVTPTKRMTIPRLELLGCCIATRLAESVKNMINKPDIPSTYWTDSSNALFWILKNENWATFVYNRVKEIRSLTKPEQWRHVPGEENPADLPSRGCSARILSASKWWEGPPWLRKVESEWPKSLAQSDPEIIMKERKKVVAISLAFVSDPPWYVQHFSKYRKIVRMISWILRWRGNARKGQPKIRGHLTVQEEDTAEVLLWKRVQSETFLETDPCIKKLKAFKDEQGLWRVKTRITMRDDTLDFNYPILLPSNHKAVLRLIQKEHEQHSHCGSQALVSILRERYWILQIRRPIRKVITSCGRCRRFEAKNCNPVEAPLPLNRVRDAKVFEIVGVDLGGPLYLKDKSKSWFVVFTCAVYRGVHLELITSLSAEAFILSLRRFISRRGRPRVMYSDNGTNFQATENALKKLDWEKIVASTSVHKIKWIFDPPSAPWWGGWWERVVGMTKKLLRRILGRASLDYEELATILCDCEEVINSRPITYISEDPMDLSSLTPNMFLRDTETGGVPDLDELETKGFNRRFQYRQKLREHLRKRFRSEYLGQLVHRKSQSNQKRQLSVGELVLIGSDDKRRLNWPLARVLELFPGRDGVIRVARLKTANGEMTRPLQRLYPLEVDPEETTFQDEKKEEGPGEVDPSVGEKVTRFGRKVKAPIRLMF